MSIMEDGRALGAEARAAAALLRAAGKEYQATHCVMAAEANESALLKHQRELDIREANKEYELAMIAVARARIASWVEELPTGEEPR